MDECMLNDLLECSVCFERLDTSSKVLPCQHTFCRKCLQDIVETNKELRCPECRVLVEIKIEELPPNVLLMRILEGMRNAAPKKQIRGPVRGSGHGPAAAPMMHYGTPVHHHAQGVPDRHVAIKQTPIHHPHQPYAKAVYDYISKEIGDLSFKKGDVIMLRKRIDTHWYHGECNGKQGVFPLTYVQIMTPMVSHSPQCKALYDFRMTNDDEEGCLTFNKGEVISVIRRVDENWAEGKLDDRIGIFPLAFVELNSLARSLMKLSTNSQPGPSRVAPPTPTTEDSTPLIPTDHSQHISTNIPSNHHQQQQQQHQQQTQHQAPQHQIQQQPQQQTHQHQPLQPSNPVVTQSHPVPTSDSSSTVSSATTTPNTSSSNTSSSSSTAPSSPASPPPRGGQNTPARTPLRNPDVSTTITSGGVNSPPPRPAVHKSQHREKRHSFTSLNNSHHHDPTQRHSVEIVSPEIVDLAYPERHRRSGDAPSPQSSQICGNVHLPAAYIALYPYKPQKADELELRKGGIYMVSERCQDGWFKGTSNRTQKCGVFPGNYVAYVRSVPKGLAAGSANLEPKITMSYTRSAKKMPFPIVSPRQGQNAQPPELPPRSVSPCTGTSTISSSWHGQPEPASAAPLGRSQSAVMATGMANSPNSIGSSATVGKPVDKCKDRKEKGGVSLMRRLTSIKKPKSPPPASYSMDNPVFEDSTVSASANVAHSVHVRSGSCPSQLLQVQPAQDGSVILPHRLFGSGSSSQRVKHKERTNIVLANLSYNARNSDNSASGGPSSSPNISQHRKSNSLDAGSKSKISIGPAERFRCIVPYPPNTEYELELQVNDIIYVHKKRDDGWYKGTLQRTGRTGLFPASFVESF